MAKKNNKAAARRKAAAKRKAAQAAAAAKKRKEAAKALKIQKAKRQKKAENKIKKVANKDGELNAKDVKKLKDKGFSNKAIKNAFKRVNDSKSGKGKELLTIASGGAKRLKIKKNKTKKVVDSTTPEDKPKDKPKDTPSPGKDNSDKPRKDGGEGPRGKDNDKPKNDKPKNDKPKNDKPKNDKPKNNKPKNNKSKDRYEEDYENYEGLNEEELPNTDYEYDGETGRFDLQESIDGLNVDGFSDYLFGKDRISYDSDGRIKEYKPPKFNRMTAKGSNTDIDLTGSLNKAFFRERGLTTNFEGNRPGSSMFNEGDTLKKTKGGKLISDKPTALDFSKGNNQVVDKKYLRKIKSTTPTMDHMMGTITGSKLNYKRMKRTNSDRGKDLLTSKHREGFYKTKKQKQADRKADRQADRKSKRQEVKVNQAKGNFSKLGNPASMGKIQSAVTKPESAGPVAPKGKRGKGLGKIRRQRRQLQRKNK